MKQNYKLSTRLHLILVCLLAALGSGAQIIQLGSGSSTSGNTTASPVNGYYNFMRYQTVYTAAEINAQGVFGASNITSLAYNITAIPAGGLPNYEIRMANTSATNCAAHVPDALTTVYSNLAPSFTPNSWNTFTLSTPFLWDGVSNVLVDVAFGSAPFTSPYGSLYTYSTTTGSRYVRCDAPCTSQANVVTTATQDTKPQVRLNFVSTSACSGTPVAGTASAPVSVCSAADFNLTLSGYTQDLNITFQWQTSPDGITFADISGGTTANILTSQTAETYYRQIITCTNSGLSDTSNVVFVTMAPSNTCYCTSEPTSSADTKIDSVQFLTVATGSFAASCDTFTDYTSLVAVAQRTVPFNLRIRNGSCSGNAYTAYVAVYVDLNQNGILNDANELVYSYGPFSTLNAIPDDSIIIPNSAALGLTRMRIVIAEGGIVPPPCGYVDYDYGETEDYTLNITAAPGCTNPPVAGSISGASSACSGNTVTLGLSGQDIGTDIQWQESTDGNSWSDITGADNTFYTTPPILDTIYYRVKATCADSSFTTAFAVTLSSFLSCYCTDDLLGFCGDADINNVNIVGTTLNNNSTCNTTLNGDAYTAFPDTGAATATLLQTVPYTFNVNTSDAAIISVWIDYDQNGIFEADEWTQVAVNALNGTAQITIPLTAQLGKTGMRVRSRLQGNPNGATDACSDFGSGEAEDYVITIGPPPPCVTSPVGGTASGPTSGIAGTTVYIYVVTGSTGNIQWQYSTTAATGPFLPIQNANDDTLSVTFNTSATYWIRAYVTTPGCDPDSSNTLPVLITYPGDDVCDAIALNFGINGPYNTAFATVQAGEPVPPRGVCTAQGSWCDSIITNSLWFRFTAPASGRVKIQSPGFDTQLALWEADNCDSILTGGAILIGASDDDANYQLHGGVNFSSHIDSAVCLTPGKTYFVQLDPYTSPGASTTIVLTDLGGVAVSLNFKTDVSCLGFGDGTIDMEVSGGSGNYTYLWSNGAVTADLSGLIGGTYTLTVTETGCQASVVSSPIVINEPTAALTVSLDSVIDANCNGASTGGVYISVTGGVAPYDITWSNFAFTEDNENVPSGSYSAFVSDANACVVSFGPETVGEPAAISVTVDSTTNSTCAGVSTGAIAISVNGGTPGYTFDWSNGDPTEDINGLMAGSYDVTVEDTEGCSVTQSATVGNNAGVSVTVDLVTNSACAGVSTGAITISVSGGTPGYTFDWSNGAVTEDISGLAAGTYDVSVEDAVGCSAAQSATVGNNTVVSVTVDAVTNSACAGVSTGVVAISVSGGTPGYTFDWSNGAVTEDISGLAADTYDVTVEDASGCTATQSAIVGNNAGVSVTVDLVTNSACAGVSTGAVTISVSGGTPGYTYDWSNGAVTEDISGLDADSYVVTVEDTDGCVATATATVGNDAGVSITVDLVTDNTCAGLTTGAVTISVSGGTPAYGFDWSNGDTTEDISSLAGGLYTVSAQDAVGCEATASATVADGAGVTVVLDSMQDVTCHGLSNGFVSISVSGGTPSYSFDWSNGDTTEDISGLGAGNYSVDVSDVNGCTAALSPVTITEPAILSITLDSIHAVDCFGGNTGAAYTTVSGGTAPTTILWDNNAITEDISGLTAGTYVATLVDANGCTVTTSAAITQPAAALTATSVATPQIQGGTLGSVDVTVSGGTSPYTALWGGGAVTEDLNNVVAGIYTCTITDANGCTTVISDTVSFITGVEDVIGSFAVNLYPNPAQDKVFLELTLNKPSDVTVDVFNINGQLVQQFAKTNMLTTTFQMNFANEASGLYYAKIKAGDTTLTKRITVAK